VETVYFWGWLMWMYLHTQKHNKLIKAYIAKHDPSGEFIRGGGGGMYFNKNMYSVNCSHPGATEEFLRGWDKVYGKFWRLVWIYMACWFLLGGCSLYILRLGLGI
jgi:hypothetical protein